MFICDYNKAHLFWKKPKRMLRVHLSPLNNLRVVSYRNYSYAKLNKN
jgi:hypothetical protein